MTAPNRSADVAAWMAMNRGLFVGDADETTRRLLTPLAQHLNRIEGRDVWGLLVKSERTPPFVPHDILMWKDTREHFDVFTGPDSGRAEDVQPLWGFNPAPPDSRWIWQSVGAGEQPGPIDPPPVDDLKARLVALEQLVVTQGATIESLRQQAAEQHRVNDEFTVDLKHKGDRIQHLEEAPEPDFQFFVEGNTGRVFGHAHPIRLMVRSRPL